MAIKFEYAGATFTADTPEEAAKTLALLKEREAQAQEEKAQQKAAMEAFMRGKIDQGREYLKEAGHLVGAFDENNFTWTRDRFLAFINRLGDQQKLVLALLLTKSSLTDVELRNALKVSGNQALAGVLSGVSKQAIALFIPPRAVFDFENFRFGGKRRSDYLVADEFRKIAAEMNWPTEPFLHG